MNSKHLWLITVILFVSIHRAEAQQATLPKIGWLGARSASAPTREVFRREIRSFGYVEGKKEALALGTLCGGLFSAAALQRDGVKREG